MSRRGPLPHGGGADARSSGLSLADRFRRHADVLTRDQRSPLSAALMYGAAADLDASGTVAALFAPVATPPGSVPQLRLLAALHHLALSGKVPELARFYPSVAARRQSRGRTASPAGAWAAASGVIAQHFDWIQDRLSRTVQTNEPGRSTVLYGALLWLTARYSLPIRLLEIGASAGLNLVPDRYCYVVDGRELGDLSSTVRFVEPWCSGPGIDIQAVAKRLQITGQGGCDREPLDPRNAEDRLTLLSYIWPDELARFQRSVAALELAADAPVPVPVERRPAGEWLSDALRVRRPSELTVIWQSVVRQYIEPDEWVAIEQSVRQSARAEPDARMVWLKMEPGEDHLTGMRLTVSEPASPAGGTEAQQLLAECGDHGPPVKWVTG